jgi:7-cyano-7-deazaguanine synthase
VELPVGLFDSSSLTGKGEIPLDHEGATCGVPSTYVPARNLVFLSLAFAWAESIGAKAVFIGVTAVDYSGYPDCRPDFIQAFQRTANMATKAGTEGAGISIEAPLMDLSKAEIVKLGSKLGLDHSLTWSCYMGGKKACGRCDSCMYRLKGFKEAGIEDPIEYEG